MNILIPHEWLLKHLKTDATPQDIQQYLSLCGPSVERIERINGEPVYDIEITTNRVDCMSIRGVAREAGAILPEFGIEAKLIPLKLPPLTCTQALDINILNNPKLCRRILAVKLSHVKTRSSPKWLQQRLTLVGQRPLNNLVDITNYVMWELGHPIHVFDYDRLTAKTIRVREAKPGERIRTLDEKEHRLLGGEVVFDDGKGTIIDLPGIMGTQNTVVTDQTRHLLLWIESIDARKIRDASMGLAIRTQAAVLNEKGVDPELGLAALLRCIQLYTQQAKARIGSRLIDLYPHKPSLHPILLEKSRLESYMGLPIDPKKVTRILTALGCKVEARQGKSDHKSYKITPPSWRAQDLTIPVDVIEEIARIHGYHNLPSLLLTGDLPLNEPETPFQLEQSIKTSLSDWGLMEIYTYSLVSAALARLSQEELSDHLKVANPLSEDQVYLRRSILPSHLEVIKKNPTQDTIKIFELAHVYQKSRGELPKEELQLAITATLPFSKLKGLVELLLEKLRIEPQWLISDGKTPLLQPNRSVNIASGEEILGFIGEVKPELLSQVGIAPPISFAVLFAKTLMAVSRPHPTYKPFPKYPPLLEDMTFILPPRTYIGEAIDEIVDTSRLIESVHLKEIFQRNATFEIIYRHPERSLSDNDVTPIRKKIKENLEQHFNAKLIGSLSENT